MTKRERLYTVLAGRTADRPPVCAYKHFPGFEHSAGDLAKKMVAFQKQFDWDFVKIQSRGTYSQEVWGDRFDFAVYENQVFPKLIHREIKSVSDLSKFVPKPVTHPVLAEQIEVVQEIRNQLSDDVPIFPTVFTPISVISSMLGAPPVRRNIDARRADNVLFDLFVTNPRAIHAALSAVAHTLAGFCQELIRSGADGIFYGAIGWARTGYLTEEEWREFVMPYDLIVLEPLKQATVLLHTCGINSNPQRFVSYPIRAIHWDSCAQGNPDLSTSKEWIGDKTPMGGLNEMLFGTNAAPQIAEECRQILQKNKNLPFIFAPNCSVAVNTSEEEFYAFRKSVES